MLIKSNVHTATAIQKYFSSPRRRAQKLFENLERIWKMCRGKKGGEKEPNSQSRAIQMQHNKLECTLKPFSSQYKYNLCTHCRVCAVCVSSSSLTGKIKILLLFPLFIPFSYRLSLSFFLFFWFVALHAQTRIYYCNHRIGSWCVVWWGYFLDLDSSF